MPSLCSRLWRVWLAMVADTESSPSIQPVMLTILVPAKVDIHLRTVTGQGGPANSKLDTQSRPEELDGKYAALVRKLSNSLLIHEPLQLDPLGSVTLCNLTAYDRYGGSTCGIECTGQFVCTTVIEGSHGGTLAMTPTKHWASRVGSNRVLATTSR
ncbi:hypothetical protein B296_00002858 [Ensete ventricosum]|uniref:Uncharacterized protein n=1 Tax=Ensete ventricosum TaxID=4639 RepID=A0A427BBM8_ENSVE|nr:hypothetical protein B296_00002858 [Ensete ventricosum]